MRAWGVDHAALAAESGWTISFPSCGGGSFRLAPANDFRRASDDFCRAGQSRQRGLGAHMRRRAAPDQLEFAARLGVPVENTANWEQGKRIAARTGAGDAFGRD